jgi:hypothetical protein
MLELWLIQRGKIKGKQENVPVKENVTWEYMGSSEFEFGALNKALKRIRANFDKYRRVVFHDIVNIHGAPLVLLHPFQTVEELQEYKEQLLLLGQDKLRLQEISYFSSWCVDKNRWDKSNRENCDIWWDIDHDVWFSFDGEYMMVAPLNWQESFKIIGE